MAKDKERTVNPAAAALKKQKQAAVKKNKAQVATQRSERLARRNPDRLERQIDDLKALESAQGGQLRPRDKQMLEQLERDVKAIRKAKETAPSGGRQYEERRDERMPGTTRGGASGGRGRGGGRGGSSLGKRRRDEENASASSDTDPEVRSIPMPRDTPPPLPRRPRPHHQDARQAGQPHGLPPKPEVKPVAQTTYSSAPQVRNLRKEATAKFVPAAVAARLKQRQAMQGGDASGRLLEPEEVDKLEQDGYLDARMAADEAAKEEAFDEVARTGAVGGGELSIEEEEAAFEKELREVELEEKKEGFDAATATRGQLASEARKDARNAATAAAEENKHIALAESAGAAPVDAVRDSQGRKAQTQLRLVEVEDVSEDEW